MKALIISSDNFEDTELFVPYCRLKEEGKIKGRHGYKKIVFIFVFLVSILIADSVLAHHPAGVIGTSQAGTIRTISATTMPRGRFALTLQTEYIKMDSFSNSELIGFAEDGEDVHTTNSISHTTLVMSYGVTDDFTISLKAFYAYLNNIKEVHAEEPDEIHRHGDAKGIGDITVLGQYRFVKYKEKDFESALIFGIKLPTGRTNDKDIHGERFETEFQPGSGSWDPIIGIAATKRIGKLSIDANVLYTIVTKGSQETDLGDLFHYNFGLSYRLYDKKVSLDAMLELNGEWKEKEKIKGVKDKNSGGSSLFISPGMRFIFSNNWSAYLSGSFPIFQNHNGIQNDTDYKALLGVVFSF